MPNGKSIFRVTNGQEVLISRSKAELLRLMLENGVRGAIREIEVPTTEDGSINRFVKYILESGIVSITPEIK